MDATKKLVEAFVAENRPLTFEQIIAKMPRVKDRQLEDVLVALQLYHYIDKLVFGDIQFYVLTCPYYGTGKFMQHLEEWLNYQKKYVLITKINKLRQINQDLEDE